MNYKWKRLAVAGGLLVAAGALCFALSLLFGARPAQLLDGTLRFPSWVSVGPGGVSFSASGNDADWADRYRGDGVYAVDADGIRALDIEWIAGHAEIAVSSGDAIEFSETAVPIAEALRWSVDNGTLRIRYCRPLGGGVQGKTLTVRIPAALAAELDALSFDSASGSLSLSGVTADMLALSTSSGTLDVSDVAAGEASLESASGGLVFSGRFDELDASSSSGAITVSCLGAAERVSLESVSGEVSFSGAAAELDASASSGRLLLTLDAEPDSVCAETSSGSVTLTLPAACSFALSYDTSSGDLDCALPVRMEGGRYLSGGGRAELRVSTSSGDLTVREGD